MSIPLIVQIQCVRREIGYRERCYPRWIESGKMPQRKADDELSAMSAVLATLQELHAQQNPELLG
jgi:hypothetical protein